MRFQPYCFIHSPMYPLAVFVFGEANYHIPLTLDDLGFFNIEVSSPSYSTAVSMRVSLGVYDLSLPRDMGRSRSARDQVSFPFHSGAVISSSPQFYPVWLESRYPCVSIAPNRALVQSAGAVAIVRDGETPQFVVRSTIDVFVGSCKRGSLIQLPIPRLGVFDGFFHIQGNDVDRIFARAQIDLHSSSTDILKVPIALESAITASIISTGAILRESSLSQYVHFANCTSRSIPNLPSIRLSLLNTLDGEFNTIVYYPEDYIEFTSGEYCKLLIVAAVSNSFSPFAIPGTNVRISNDSMMSICDANRTQSFVSG